MGSQEFRSAELQVFPGFQQRSGRFMDQPPDSPGCCRDAAATCPCMPSAAEGELRPSTEKKEDFIPAPPLNSTGFVLTFGWRREGQQRRSWGEVWHCLGHLPGLEVGWELLWDTQPWAWVPGDTEHPALGLGTQSTQPAVTRCPGHLGVLEPGPAPWCPGHLGVLELGGHFSPPLHTL